MPGPGAGGPGQLGPAATRRLMIPIPRTATSSGTDSELWKAWTLLHYTTHRICFSRQAERAKAAAAARVSLAPSTTAHQQAEFWSLGPRPRRRQSATLVGARGAGGDDDDDKRRASSPADTQESARLRAVQQTRLGVWLTSNFQSRCQCQCRGGTGVLCCSQADSDALVEELPADAATS